MDWSERRQGKYKKCFIYPARKDKSQGDKLSSGFFILSKYRKEKNMSWLYLLIAGIFEITWAVGLKLSNGFTHPVSSAVTIIGMIACYYFLAISLKEIPLGTAYAVWTGIGTVGTIILGIILFKEPVSLMRFLCIGLIICGITGLKILAA